MQSIKSEAVYTPFCLKEAHANNKFLSQTQQSFLIKLTFEVRLFDYALATIRYHDCFFLNETVFIQINLSKCIYLSIWVKISKLHVLLQIFF